MARGVQVQSMELTQRVVIVTGASAGIGAATVRALAQAGAHVVLTARRADRLEALAAEVAGCPGRRLAMAGDIQDPGLGTQLVETTLAHFGRLDVVINNAGLGQRSYVSATPAGTVETIWRTNLLGPLQLIQAALPVMRQQGEGEIVNISSIVGQRPLVDNGVYAASKAALNVLSRSLRMELQGQGIGVTLVYPGMTQTEFHQALLDNPGRSRFNWLRVSPDRVARAIVVALQKGRREVYVTPWDWGVVQLSRWLPRPTDKLIAHLFRRAW